MGLYINPPNTSKEAWLLTMLIEKYAKEITKDEFYQLTWSTIPDEKVVLILINNESFTALAVLYSQTEFEYFQNHLKTDLRKTWVILCQKEQALEFAR